MDKQTKILIAAIGILIILFLLLTLALYGVDLSSISIQKGITIK